MIVERNKGQKREPGHHRPILEVRAGRRVTYHAAKKTTTRYRKNNLLVDPRMVGGFSGGVGRCGAVGGGRGGLCGGWGGWGGGGGGGGRGK